MSLLNRNDLFIPEFCETAIIGGESFDVIPTESVSEDMYTNYGLEEKVDVALEVWKSDFIYSELPGKGEKITFRGATWRLVKAVDGSSNETAKLFAVSLSSRR